MLGPFAHSACKKGTRLAYGNGVHDKVWQNVPQAFSVRAICAIGIIELDCFLPVQVREVGPYHALDLLDWDREAAASRGKQRLYHRRVSKHFSQTSVAIAVRALHFGHLGEAEFIETGYASHSQGYSELVCVYGNL